MTEDPLIGRLNDERDALLERVSAIDSAIEILTGTRSANGPSITRRQGSVGADKVALVRDFIAKHREVRQAEITHALGLNSGTVSTATAELELQGEIEELPKRDRSKVWRAVR